MNRIKKAFDNGKAFIGFITGGDPNLESCYEYILRMAEAGADLIEIGIPFSDPVAEGPVIQAANIRALAGGTNIDKLLIMVERVREKTDIPLVFMTYLNPVHNFGYEKFFEECKRVGIDGIIVPDLPFEEKKEIEPYAKKHNVDVISLIAPNSEKRIEKIAKNAEGFIYIVSSMGVTGVRREIETDIKAITKSIRKERQIPIAVGFGISTPKQARDISKYSDGVIVGSAIVEIIEQYGEHAGEHIYQFVKTMKDEINK